MKLLFARIICLQAVILLTSGILFGAIDQKNSSNSSFKKLHFSQKSEINFESFSFFEEEEEEEEDNHLINFSTLFDYESCSFYFKNRHQTTHNSFITKNLSSRSDKTPIWIKIRSIII